MKCLLWVLAALPIALPPLQQTENSASNSPLIFRRIGVRSGEAHTLLNIGSVYSNLGENKQAETSIRRSRLTHLRERL